MKQYTLTITGAELKLLAKALDSCRPYCYEIDERRPEALQWASLVGKLDDARWRQKKLEAYA